jgi:ATP-dependent Lon protease
MRYRQLLNDIGSGGVFGHVYYSPENSKLAMVGTLARIKKTERLDDGGLYVLLEGIGKFYLRDIVSEKPYLKAKVQMFNDWTENEALLESLEQNVLKEVRVSVKVMKLLYPQNNYTMNQSVLKYRPPLSTSGVRLVQLPGSDTELQRRSKFSFATMDMLKTDPVTKLLFLQEPVLERRYKNMLRVLEESTAFLEGELRKRGVVTDVGIAKLREEALNDLSDLAPPQSQESQQLIRDQDNFFPIEL